MYRFFIALPPVAVDDEVDVLSGGPMLLLYEVKASREQFSL